MAKAPAKTKKRAPAKKPAKKKATAKQKPAAKKRAPAKKLTKKQADAKKKKNNARRRANYKKQQQTPPPPPPKATPGIPAEFNPQLILMTKPDVGRPTKYTKALPVRILELYYLGYTVPMICHNLFISKATYYNWCQDHPEFLDAHSKGQAASQGWWEQTMRLGAIGALKNYKIRPATAIMQHHHGYKEPEPQAADPEEQPLLVSFGEYIEEDEEIIDVEAEVVKSG